MPSKTRAKNAAIAAKSAALPKIPKELLDQFVQGPMTAEAIQDVSMAFKKALIERALGGELSHHLGYAPGGDKPATADHHRNGSTGKTVLTEDDRCASRCRATGRAPSSRCSFRSTNGASPGSTTRSWPCTRVA